MVIANLVGDWYWPVLAIIILFGGSQLPKLARNAGLAMKEFRSAHAEAGGASPTGATTHPPVQFPVPQLPAATTPSLAGAAVATPLPAGVPAATTAQDNVTLTRAELDALLAHREAQVRANSQAQPPAPA